MQAYWPDTTTWLQQNRIAYYDSAGDPLHITTSIQSESDKPGLTDHPATITFTFANEQKNLRHTITRNFIVRTRPSYKTEDVGQDTLREINQYRRQQRLKELRWDAGLVGAAEKRAHAIITGTYKSQGTPGRPELIFSSQICEPHRAFLAWRNEATNLAIPKRADLRDATVEVWQNERYRCGFVFHAR